MPKISVTGGATIAVATERTWTAAQLATRSVAVSDKPPSPNATTPQVGDKLSATTGPYGPMF